MSSRRLIGPELAVSQAQVLPNILMNLQLQ